MNSEEKDVLKDMPIRDLLDIAKPALDNPFLQAIVDAGQTPAASFKHMQDIGLPELGPTVKAACFARIRLAGEWVKFKKTEIRPAESMFRFSEQNFEDSKIRLNTHLKFGEVEIDQTKWPLLLREFRTLESSEKPGEYYTSVDYAGGRWLDSFIYPEYLFHFSHLEPLERILIGTKQWDVNFSGHGIFWTNQKFHVHSKVALLQSCDQLNQNFPDCFKALEITQEFDENEWEMERIRIQLELGKSQRGFHKLTFEKFVSINKSWYAKMEFGYHVDMAEGGTDINTLTFVDHANINNAHKGQIISIWPKGNLDFYRLAPDEPKKDFYSRLTKLAEPMSRVRKLELEPIVGRTLLSNPPEFLHDLFIMSV